MGLSGVERDRTVRQRVEVDDARRQRGGCVSGQAAELAGVPERERWTVPSLTKAAAAFGVPSPVSITLPRYWGRWSGNGAAAAIPTVVGEMMPFSLG